MPRYTQYCPLCGWRDDIFAKPFELPPCPHCGMPTDRLWVGTSASVQDDSFVGGRTYENLGHEPVTVYSRSELKAELKKRNLEEFVRHVPVPGTDKSPHTTRWDAPSPYTLAAAKALLDRVGTVAGPAPKEPRTAGAHIDRTMVEEAWNECQS